MPRWQKNWIKICPSNHDTYLGKVEYDGVRMPKGSNRNWTLACDPHELWPLLTLQEPPNFRKPTQARQTSYS